jgi:hypothetical protein
MMHIALLAGCRSGAIFLCGFCKSAQKNPENTPGKSREMGIMRRNNGEKDGRCKPG